MRAAQRLGEKTADIEAPEPGSQKGGSDPFRPRTAPGGALAFQSAMRDKQAEIDRLQQELAKAKASGSSMEIPLDMLVEVPGRRRILTEDQKLELRENLRHNKLTHPITVRPLPDGRFEVVSGHNRAEQFGELQRTAIPAIPIEMTDEEAAANAFYANLLQSDLTDYEKFLGFKEMLARHPGWTHAQISEQSGVSRTQVTTLLAFERLPTEALNILQENRGILGAKAAAELAAVADQGKAERVVKAVQQIADKKLDQSQAVKFAKSSEAPPVKAAPAAESFKVKAGKATWCDVRLAKNVMRIEFSSEGVAQAVREAIKMHLEALAASDQVDQKS